MDRTVPQKLSDFASAATHRAFDMDGWRQWTRDEREKFVGIGDGLNAAKDDVVHLAAGACRAVTDGSALNAAAHVGQYVLPAVALASEAVVGVVQHPDVVLRTLADASRKYSQLPPREQGKVIGETMFAMVNPEGSLEGPTLAFRAADSVAMHVDAAVINGIEKFVQAVREMQLSAPEFVDCAQEMLNDYLRSIGLGPKEFSYSGGPWPSFRDIEETSPAASEYLAMVKDAGPGWELTENGRLRRIGSERESFKWAVLDEEKGAEGVIRQSENTSCVAAVAQMLTMGLLKERDLIDAWGHDKMASFDALLLKLAQAGLKWSDRKAPWSELVAKPFAALMVDGPNLHCVLVQGVDELNGMRRVVVVDPWEGTRYKMALPVFQEFFTGLVVRPLE